MSEGTEIPNKWVPMTDLIALAHLGKLSEEAGELSSIVSRCIIQGIDECDPETGKPNRQALLEELSDVAAMSQMAIDYFGLDTFEFCKRVDRKMKMKKAWHAMLRE